MVDWSSAGNQTTENNRQPRHKGILVQYFCLLGDLLREYSD